MTSHDDDCTLGTHTSTRRSLAEGHSDRLAIELSLKGLWNVSCLENSLVCMCIADLVQHVSF